MHHFRSGPVCCRIWFDVETLKATNTAHKPVCFCNANSLFSQRTALLAASHLAEPYLCEEILSLLLPRNHATNQMDCEVERAAAEAAPKRPAAVCCCYCGCATKARKDASHKQAGNQLPVCACACAVFDVCSDRCQLHLLSVTVAFRSGNIAEVESKKSNKHKQSQQAKYTQVNLFLVECRFR